MRRIVDDRLRAHLMRAVRATEECSIGIDAVADDLAATMAANRRELLDRAFEAVKGVARSRGHDLEGEVVVVTADFTFRHKTPSRVGRIEELDLHVERQFGTVARFAVKGTASLAGRGVVGIVRLECSRKTRFCVRNRISQRFTDDPSDSLETENRSTLVVAFADSVVFSSHARRRIEHSVMPTHYPLGSYRVATGSGDPVFPKTGTGIALAGRFIVDLTAFRAYARVR